MCIEHHLKVRVTSSFEVNCQITSNILLKRSLPCKWFRGMKKKIIQISLSFDEVWTTDCLLRYATRKSHSTYQTPIEHLAICSALLDSFPKKYTMHTHLHYYFGARTMCGTRKFWAMLRLTEASEIKRTQELFENSRDKKKWNEIKQRKSGLNLNYADRGREGAGGCQVIDRPTNRHMFYASKHLFDRCHLHICSSSTRAPVAVAIIQNVRKKRKKKTCRNSFVCRRCRM